MESDWRSERRGCAAPDIFVSWLLLAEDGDAAAPLVYPGPYDPTGLCKFRDDDVCIDPGGERGKIVTNGSGHDVTEGDKHAYVSKNNNPWANDEIERRINLDAKRAKELRDQRLKEVMNGAHSYGRYLAEVARENRTSCAGMGPERGACNMSDAMSREFVQKPYVKKILSRIDEGWTRDGQFSDDEFESAWMLAFEGKHVVARNDAYGAAGADDNRGYDAWVDGARAEFKSASGSANSIQKQLRRANGQHAEQVYVYITDTTDKGTVNAAIDSYLRSSTPDFNYIRVFYSDVRRGSVDVQRNVGH